MSEKTLNNIRIINKHDTEVNWLKATGFTPKQGEVIIYDIDSTHSYERIKIGDGVQNVNALPFVDDALKGYVDTSIAEIPTPDVSAQIDAHNTSEYAHSDIRADISDINSLIGDKSVSEQINDAVVNKADLIDGKIPTDQLPSTFSGQETTIVAKDKIQVGSVVYVVGGGAIDSTPKGQLDLDDMVSAVAFSPDGKLVVIGGWFEGYTKVYSISGTTLTYIDSLKADNSGEELDDRATAFYFSPDGKVLYVYGDFTGAAKIYSVSGTNITYVNDIYKDNAQTAFPVSGESAECMAVSQDGTRMAISVNFTGSFILYSVSGTTVTPLATIATHNGNDVTNASPNHLAFSPDGSLLVAVCWDYVKVYTVSGNNANFLREFPDHTLEGQSHWSNTCAFSPDGKIFAICGYGNVLARVYSVSGTTFTLIKDIPFNAPLDYDDYDLEEISFSADSKYMLLCGTYLGGARIYDVSDNSVPLVTDLSFGTSGWDIAYCGKISPDGSVVIVGGDAEVRCKVYGASQEVVSALNGEHASDYSVAIAQETIEAGESGKIMIVASVKSPDVSGQIEVHNSSETAHNDIRVAVNDLSALVGDTSVSEQIAAANMIYVGPDRPTDPSIKVWINTAEDGTGVVPVLPRVSTIDLSVSGWAGSSSPYSQVVTINTVTAATKIELNPTVAQIVSLQNDDIALMAQNDAGIVTVYSFGGKPSGDMLMQVTLTEVSYV